MEDLDIFKLNPKIEIQPWYAGLLAICEEALHAEVDAGRMTMREAASSMGYTVMQGAIIGTKTTINGRND